MKSAKYFTSVYLSSRYWQCFSADQDIPKTAYHIGCGLYEWVVAPMGLTSAPAMFMHTINSLFSSRLDSSMKVFLGGILMCSCTVKEHFILLKKVLAC